MRDWNSISFLYDRLSELASLCCSCFTAIFSPPYAIFSEVASLRYQCVACVSSSVIFSESASLCYRYFTSLASLFRFSESALLCYQCVACLSFREVQ